MIGREKTDGSICLVTCRRVPQLAEDDRPLHQALQKAGWPVDIAVWDDPDVPWSTYRAVILRSTWDYHLRPAEFRSWLHACEEAGIRLWNPPGLMQWNLHKAYLQELANNGLPTVPTEFLRCGQSCDLERLLDARGWSDAVVKPAISATAHQTFRTSSATAKIDNPRLESYLASADFIVQPFVPEIESAGEISFLFFGGRYSHAVLKKARQGDFRVQSDFGGSATLITPDARLLAQAHRIAEAIPEPWLYARIDVVNCGGQLVVMEVELIEPQLFLLLFEEAASNLVAALERCLVAGS